MCSQPVEPGSDDVIMKPTESALSNLEMQPGKDTRWNSGLYFHSVSIDYFKFNVGKLIAVH